MKKRLTMLLLAAALLPMMASAQAEYAKEGKVWTGERGIGVRAFPTVYYLKGDTIVGADTYKKRYEVDFSGGMETRQYSCAVREEDGRVYFLYPNSTEERLEMDFNMQPGDELLIDEYTMHRVLAVTTVNLNGTERRVLVMIMLETDMDVNLNDWSFDDGRIYLLIEGIGCPTHMGESDNGWGIMGGWLSSFACYEDSQRIFDTYDELELIDQIRSDIATAPRIRAVLDRYYDLQGRRIAAEPAKGVYIHNGKKVTK